MADRKKQSPHYIPDLDPQHDPGGRLARPIWAMIALGLMFCFGSAPFFAFGAVELGAALLILGVLVIAVVYLF